MTSEAVRGIRGGQTGEVTHARLRVLAITHPAVVRP